MAINYHYDLRLYFGLYEFETQKWFRRLVKKGSRCFDVGGAGAYDALLLSKLSGAGDVVSFECDDRAASEMLKTVKLNSYPIEVVKAYVSENDENGQMSLDAAAKRYFVPDFIKIDIEGAEDRALLGADSILTSRKPSMIIEVHGKEKENRCLAILKRYGYEAIIVDRGKFLQEQRPIGHNRWLVCKGRD